MDGDMEIEVDVAALTGLKRSSHKRRTQTKNENDHVGESEKKTEETEVKAMESTVRNGGDEGDVMVFAATKREEGNEAFKKGRYAEAVVSYAVAADSLDDRDEDQRQLKATLMSNSAAARLALRDYEGAREDAETAVAGFQHSLGMRKLRGKALYRLAMATYACGAGDVCRASEILAESRSVLEEEEKRTQTATGTMMDAVRRAESRFANTARALCEQKIAAARQGDHEVQSLSAFLRNGENGEPFVESMTTQKVHDTDALASELLSMLHRLEKEPLCRASFGLNRSDNVEGGYAFIIRVFSHCHDLARKILVTASASPGMWPVSVDIVGVAKYLIDQAYEPATYTSILRLLADLSIHPDVACTLASPSLMKLLDSLTIDTIGAADALVVLLFRLASGPESATGLANVGVRPFLWLLEIFMGAEDFRTSHTEAATGVSQDVHRPAADHESLRAVIIEERRRIFKPHIFALRKRCLTTFSVIVHQTTALDSISAADHASIVRGLVAALEHVHKESPKKLAPVCGLDGTTKEYVKRAYAADYIDNEAGDALKDLPEELLRSIHNDIGINDTYDEWAGIDAVVDASLSSMTLIEMAIACCVAVCSRRNIAALFHECTGGRILGLAGQLSMYATNSVRYSAETLVSKITASSRAAATEALHDECAALTRGCALALRKAPSTGLRGCDALLKEVATMPGDDFRDLCRANGVLDAAIAVIRREGASPQDEKVFRVCEDLFLQCIERERQMENAHCGGVWAALGHARVDAIERAARDRRAPSAATLEQMERDKVVKTLVRPKVDKWNRPIYYGEDHASKVKRVPANAAVGEAIGSTGTHSSPTVASPRKSSRKSASNGDSNDDDGRGGYDEDGIRVVMDSGATGAIREARREWLNMPLRNKLRWTQNSTDITAWVLLPRHTKRKEVSVHVTPTRLTVKLSWHGRVLDGPLRRRCKAGESCWILEDDTSEVQIILPKDDAQFWRSLFEGGEEKSYYEVLQEMVNANDDDAMPRSYEDLPERSKDLLDEIRERQELISEGILDPDGLDDFRCVLGDGDGAK